MSLHRYFKSSSSVENDLGGLVPSSVISSVDKEIQKEKDKKRGSYMKFTPEQKAIVAKSACLHGVKSASTQFSKKLEKEVKVTTIRDWLHTERKRRRSEESDVIDLLTSKETRKASFVGGED